MRSEQNPGQWQDLARGFAPIPWKSRSEEKQRPGQYAPACSSRQISSLLASSPDTALSLGPPFSLVSPPPPHYRPPRPLPSPHLINSLLASSLDTFCSAPAAEPATATLSLESRAISLGMPAYLIDARRNEGGWINTYNMGVDRGEWTMWV